MSTGAENIQANIVVNADIPAAAQVAKLTAQLAALNKQIDRYNSQALFAKGAGLQGLQDSINKTGRWRAEIVDLTSEVDHFGKALDRGKLKSRQMFTEWRQQLRQRTREQSNLNRLAKQQVALQNSMLIDAGAATTGYGPGGAGRKGLLIGKSAEDLKTLAERTQVANERFRIMNKMVGDMSTGIINWGKNTQWAGRQLTVGIAVPLGILAVTIGKKFRDIDKEITRFKRVYGDAFTMSSDTNNAVKDVNKIAREFAASYGIQAKETVSLAADLAAAGYQGTKLNGALTQTTRLAVLGETDRQEALKTTLALQSAFNLNTQELADTINFLNAVENQTSTSLQDFTVAIPKAGPVIKALGGDIEDLAVLLTALREGGIAAGEGANAIKTGLFRITNPTKKTVQYFDSLGINIEEISKKSVVDLVGSLKDLGAMLENLSPDEQTKAAGLLFGTFQGARLLTMVKNLNKEGSQALTTISLANKSAGELGGLAAKELDAVANSASTKWAAAFESLQLSLLPLGATLVEAIIPALNLMTVWVDKLINGFKALPDWAQNIIKMSAVFAALAGPVIMIVGTLGNFLGYLVKIGQFGANLIRLAAGLGGAFSKWGRQTAETVAASKAVDQERLSVEGATSALLKSITARERNNATLAEQNALLASLIPKLQEYATLTGATARAYPSRIPVDEPGSSNRNKGPRIRRAGGGLIPGQGNTDSVPAMLTPGEFVIRKTAVQKFGLANLMKINSGRVTRFARGGRVENDSGLKLYTSRGYYLPNTINDRLDKSEGRPVYPDEILEAMGSIGVGGWAPTMQHMPGFSGRDAGPKLISSGMDQIWQALHQEVLAQIRAMPAGATVTDPQFARAVDAAAAKIMKNEDGRFSRQQVKTFSQGWRRAGDYQYIGGNTSGNDSGGGRFNIFRGARAYPEISAGGKNGAVWSILSQFLGSKRLQENAALPTKDPQRLHFAHTTPYLRLTTDDPSYTGLRDTATGRGRGGIAGLVPGFGVMTKKAGRFFNPDYDPAAAVAASGGSAAADAMYKAKYKLLGLKSGRAFLTGMLQALGIRSPSKEVERLLTGVADGALAATDDMANAGRRAGAAYSDGMESEANRRAKGWASRRAARRERAAGAVVPPQFVGAAENPQWMYVPPVPGAVSIIGGGGKPPGPGGGGRHRGGADDSERSGAGSGKHRASNWADRRAARREEQLRRVGAGNAAYYGKYEDADGKGNQRMRGVPGAGRGVAGAGRMAFSGVAMAAGTAAMFSGNEKLAMGGMALSFLPSLLPLLTNPLGLITAASAALAAGLIFAVNKAQQAAEKVKGEMSNAFVEPTETAKAFGVTLSEYKIPPKLVSDLELTENQVKAINQEFGGTIEMLKGASAEDAANALKDVYVNLLSRGFKKEDADAVIKQIADAAGRTTIGVKVVGELVDVKTTQDAYDLQQKRAGEAVDKYRKNSVDKNLGVNIAGAKVATGGVLNNSYMRWVAGKNADGSQKSWPSRVGSWLNPSSRGEAFVNATMPGSRGPLRSIVKWGVGLAGLGLGAGAMPVTALGDSYLAAKYNEAEKNAAYNGASPDVIGKQIGAAVASVLKNENLSSQASASMITTALNNASQLDAAGRSATLTSVSENFKDDPMLQSFIKSQAAVDDPKLAALAIRATNVGLDWQGLMEQDKTTREKNILALEQNTRAMETWKTAQQVADAVEAKGQAVLVEQAGVIKEEILDNTRERTDALDEENKRLSKRKEIIAENLKAFREAQQEKTDALSKENKKLQENLDKQVKIFNKQKEAIEKRKKTIEDSRQATLKLLEAEQRRDSYNAQVEKSKIGLAAAISGGDMQKAAEIKAEMDANQSSYNKENAQNSINNAADAQLKAYDDQITKINEKEEKIREAIEKQIDGNSKRIEQINELVTAREKAADREVTAIDKIISRNNTLKDSITKAGNAAVKQIDDIVKSSDPLETKVGKIQGVLSSAGELANTIDGKKIMQTFAQEVYTSIKEGYPEVLDILGLGRDEAANDYGRGKVLDFARAMDARGIKVRHGGGFVGDRGGRSMSAGVMQDEVPTLLQAGEFVVKRKAVDKYGADMLHSINTGSYHGGGIVTSTLGKVAGAGARAKLGATAAGLSFANIPLQAFADEMRAYRDSGANGPSVIPDGNAMSDVEEGRVTGKIKNVGEALSFLQGQVNSGAAAWKQLCERLARTAYGLPGMYNSARSHWNNIPSWVPKSNNSFSAPPGALGFWNTGQYGHVAVSAGSGMYYTNLASGKVGILNAASLNSWGPLLGVTEPWWQNDAYLDLPQMRAGGHVMKDNVLANLHNGEIVLTKPLAGDLMSGIKSFKESGSSGVVQNVEINISGADTKTAEEISWEVVRKLEQRERQMKGRRTV